MILVVAIVVVLVQLFNDDFGSFLLNLSIEHYTLLWWMQDFAFWVASDTLVVRLVMSVGISTLVIIPFVRAGYAQEILDSVPHPSPPGD